MHDGSRAHGGVSPRGPSNGWPARQTVNVWLALIGPPSPSGQGCAFGEGERVLREPRARRDALGPRVGPAGRDLPAAATFFLECIRFIWRT